MAQWILDSGDPSEQVWRGGGRTWSVTWRRIRYDTIR